MSEASSWSPLGNPVFRALWLAILVSNIGTWMHEVGAGWMMTNLTTDPLMVALVQAATSLPMFLFALPSGVLADIVDRRKFLLFANLWMLVAAGLLGVLAIFNVVTPTVLLLITFMLGTGAAMAAPSFQAILPELVGKESLSAAVALNSLSVNISRAIGPALGALILSLTMPASVFILNALSVLGVVVVIYKWKPAPRVQRLPPEHFYPAIRAGVRYVHSAPLLRVTLIRAFVFFIFGSAAWALLPLIARTQLKMSAGGYGLLLTCIGTGAVIGALLLPRFRKKYSNDRLTVIASAVFAAAIFALAFLKNVPLICIALLFTGAAWIAMLSILSVTAQRSSAGWVKARAMAVYLVVFFGSMALGSAMWGQMSSMVGIPSALGVAGMGMLLSCFAALRWKLDMSPDLDLTPSGHLSEPGRQYDPEHDAGPVLITIEYRVSKENSSDFKSAVQELRRVRRRGGALSWGIFEDINNPERYVETFTTESWLEHLRQHDRVTQNDKAIMQKVLQFHIGPDAPHVDHLIAPQ